MIDLRSDTVTRPSAAMRQYMAQAPVGDDVFDEDPMVHELQTEVAALLGKEDALYCSSGCMTNQLALNIQTQSGDEAIVEADAHIFNYETTAASFLSRIQLNPIKAKSKGILTVDDVDGAIREPAYYMPVSRVLAIENTHNRAGGTIYPIERIIELSEFARSKGILMHLDGARLWNACAATGVSPKEYAQHFDTVSVCFSKGLGAPVGSAICGTKEHIVKARRMRKIWGGGMRQAGIIAAGALYALRNNRERIKEDNANAGAFAEIVGKHAKKASVDLDSVETNIVLIELGGKNRDIPQILSELATKGVRLSQGKKTSLRAAAHLDVSREDCVKAAGIVAEYLS
ncbi:MAG: GntG family PLP-dependent aldolase [Bacteroidota bacterium]|nr:GntG family PLP-dependent aldolase [Bacteroidota bacterium]